MKTLSLLLLILLSSPVFSLVNTEILRKKTLEPGLTHLVATKVDSYSGNSNYNLIDLTYRTDFYTIKNQGFLVANLKQGTESGGRFENTGFLHLRAITPINDRFKAETYIQKEFDEFISLKSRFVFGGGFRYTPKNKREDTKWHIGLGAFWEEEVISNGKDKTLIRLGSYSTIRHTVPEKLSLHSITYYQPHLEFFSDYRLQSDNTIQFFVSNALSFDIAFKVKYDSDPALGIEKLDTQITNGITVRFDIDARTKRKRRKMRNESVPPQKTSAKDYILVPVPIEGVKAEEKIIIRSPG